MVHEGIHGHVQRQEDQHGREHALSHGEHVKGRLSILESASTPHPTDGGEGNDSGLKDASHRPLGKGLPRHPGAGDSGAIQRRPTLSAVLINILVQNSRKDDREGCVYEVEGLDRCLNEDLPPTSTSDIDMAEVRTC